MRAFALGQDLRYELNDVLVRTRSWQPENRAPVDAVMDVAFTTIIRRRFAPDESVEAITRWVANVRSHFDAERMSVAVGETLVRVALGENLAVDDIWVGDAFLCRIFLFFGAFSDLYWGHGREKDVAALDAILVAAEQAAAEKGLMPLLMSEVEPPT